MNILDNLIYSLNSGTDIKPTDEEVAELGNKYPFLKLDKKGINNLLHLFFKEEHKSKKINWEFVRVCYSLPSREYQFIAIDYLKYQADFLKKDDIFQIESLLQIKSWWDTVDELSKLIGPLIVKYPELKDSVIKEWIISKNLWLNRASIICQIGLGDNTDVNLLKKAIINNSARGELFLDRAIGSALGDYSEVDIDWTLDFIKDNFISSVSKIELKKYIN